MTVDLTNPMFHDVDAAREWLESSRWPTGSICPHCDDKAVIAWSGRRTEPAFSTAATAAGSSPY